MYFIPGSDKQKKFLIQNVELEGKSILVIGSSSATIALELSKKSKTKVELIVEDYDSLMNSKIEIESDPNVECKLMDFECTDYDKEQFDIIYAQASVSLERRNKIIKEIKKILKKDGIFCVGEIVSLRQEPPLVVKNVWKDSGLMPLFIEDIDKYYSERQFEVLHTENYSDELEKFYIKTIEELKKVKKNLSEQELSYHKKLLNRISHESKLYLNQGGDRIIGFKILILKKG